MTPGADSSQTANQARRLYTDQLIKGLPAVATAIQERARVLLDKAAEPAVSLRRRELVQQLPKAIHPWLRHITEGMRQALLYGVSASRPVDLPPPGSRGSSAGLSLVDDDTIEREILTSRLALAIMDRASWEFTDLRSRIAMLEGRQELETHDMLRAHVLARVVLDAWRTAGMAHDGWREVQTALHEEFALLVEEAYHEVNRWLVSRRVLPEVDLRPFIRRSKNSAGAAGGGGGGGNTDMGPLSAPMSGPYTQQGSGPMTGMSGGSSSGATTGYSGRRAVVHEETRLMTRAGPLPRTGEHAEAVLGRLNKLVARHLPAFSETEVARPVSPGLANAINQAEVGLRERMTPGPQGEGGVLTTPALLEDLQQRKAALKQAATTPVERATIEIVAMMFQSILTEERIPAAVRIWFARLQMPVLRVAVSEPDFFATTDHPARRLIDRMGACVMGFDSSSEKNVGDALEKEIKRVVQVVEAYPDTGRRVFQTVLTEFEKFLEHYFKNTNEMTRKGVSLAQQIEQRETLAIQFTIELRRMLNEVPVQEGVRNFLFQVWADVLATTAVRFGAQSDQTKQMKRAAADLIWSASAKVSREERAEVIRRLPPLLKALRDGMASAGMPKDKQDEHVQSLNNSLAAAFTAKAAVIPSERLEELMSRLESLEEMLPDAADVKIDESMMHDLSGHESADIEVVTAGGSMPTPAMLAWARELQVGSWFMLDYRNRNEAVQLSWQGMKRQLSLFVTPGGRAVLFQQQRLAAFLQAGLLLPAQDESLTVRATRSALAKLDGDPSRLLN